MKEYFTLKDGSDELECRCGKCNGSVDGEFREKLNSARWLSNTPYIITSGYRCKTHNKNVGGSVTSSHMKAVAADIAFEDILQMVKITHGLSVAGFTRIGVNMEKQFIHVDSSKTKPDSIWTY